MKLSTKKAFTLIELLVVIAIIAILAAILFPVFAQAKVAAKKAMMISNAKQMGTGVLMYMSDTDDVFCPSMWYMNDWGMRSFAVLCNPYMKNYGILMDPFTPATLASNPFILNSQWAMPTRRSASAWCPTDENNVGLAPWASTTRMRELSLLVDNDGDDLGLPVRIVSQELGCGPRKDTTPTHLQ